jgi:hypothetical protein
MRYVLLIGMALGLFGHSFCLLLLPLAASETGWLPEYDYIQANGLVSLAELAALALAVKAAALLKRTHLIRI